MEIFYCRADDSPVLSPSELRVRCSLGKRAANSVVLALPVNQPPCQFLENIEQNWLNATAPARLRSV